MRLFGNAEQLADNAADGTAEQPAFVLEMSTTWQTWFKADGTKA